MVCALILLGNKFLVKNEVVNGQLVHTNNLNSDDTNYRVLYQIKQRIPPIMAISIS